MHAACAGECGSVTEQGLAFVAPFPEASCSGGLAIRPACDRLIEAAHEPGKAAEPLTAESETIGIAQKRLVIYEMARFIGFAILRGEKQVDH